MHIFIFFAFSKFLNSGHGGITCALETIRYAHTKSYALRNAIIFQNTLIERYNKTDV